MHTLYVRNVPSQLYEGLRDLAEERGTSIGREAIRLLERALQIDHAGVHELLDDIEEHRLPARPGTPSAADLIRRDRDTR